MAVRHQFRKGEEQPVPSQVEDSALPTVYIPAGTSQVESLAIGDEVRIVLKGTVRGLSQNEWGDNLDLELRASEVSGGSREAEAVLSEASPDEMF